MLLVLLMVLALPVVLLVGLLGRALLPQLLLERGQEGLRGGHRIGRGRSRRVRLVGGDAGGERGSGGGVVELEGAVERVPAAPAVRLDVDDPRVDPQLCRDLLGVELPVGLGRPLPGAGRPVPPVLVDVHRRVHRGRIERDVVGDGLHRVRGVVAIRMDRHPVDVAAQAGLIRHQRRQRCRRIDQSADDHRGRGIDRMDRRARVQVHLGVLGQVRAGLPEHVQVRLVPDLEHLHGLLMDPRMLLPERPALPVAAREGLGIGRVVADVRRRHARVLAAARVGGPPRRVVDDRLPAQAGIAERRRDLVVVGPVVGMHSVTGGWGSPVAQNVSVRATVAPVARSAVSAAVS